MQREPWYGTEIETDGEIKRDRDQERNQQKLLGLRYKTGLQSSSGNKGAPSRFERGFRTYLKVKSNCLLKVPSFLHFFKEVFLKTDFLC